MLKVALGVGATAAAGFIVGGGVGAVIPVGLSWLFPSYVIQPTTVVGFAKFASVIGGVVGGGNGLFRAHHAGLCKRKISVCTYVSRLLGA